VHRIAVTQIRMEGLGKTYYQKKRTEGMSTPEALRCLKTSPDPRRLQTT
jgi:hypothetical protein